MHIDTFTLLLWHIFRSRLCAPLQIFKYFLGHDCVHNSIVFSVSYLRLWLCAQLDIFFWFLDLSWRMQFFLALVTVSMHLKLFACTDSHYGPALITILWSAMQVAPSLASWVRIYLWCCSDSLMIPVNTNFNKCNKWLSLR